VLEQWPVVEGQEPQIMVLTDGGRILGLGVSFLMPLGKRGGVGALPLVRGWA
jgi:hypothetical protein